MSDGSSSNRFTVIARDGLRLRSGASQDASVIRTIPEGTVVNVLSREGQWALVDLEGDSKADGFMSLPFLRAVDASTASAGGPAGTGDITGLVTADMVKRTFPAATGSPRSRRTCRSCWPVCGRASSATAPWC